LGDNTGDLVSEQSPPPASRYVPSCGSTSDLGSEYTRIGGGIARSIFPPIQFVTPAQLVGINLSNVVWETKKSLLSNR
ncbi:hypothetical protein CHS0354_024897, partial [Potamilus streckersoni]